MQRFHTAHTHHLMLGIHQAVFLRFFTGSAPKVDGKVGVASTL
ncbi:Uncharacterised protein [Vibrio cholerae]|nr:hypothetical protein VS84_03427 [Vibrio cholerae]KKP19069.1 hypothetical protein VS86_03419 [Vibrio cholerae]CSD15696.1 Uncharacterised protein [Vibrio cholerae]